MESKENDQSNYDEVKIIAEGKVFFFPGKTLANESDYFDAMFFKSGMKECILKTVELPMISASVMEKIESFVKEHKIGFKEDNILDITAAATMLQIKRLCENCCEYLLSILKPHNCLSIMSFSDQHSLQDVHLKATQIALWNFVDVIQGDEYESLTLEELLKYLRDDRLNIEYKADAVYAILKWMWISEDARCDHDKLVSLLTSFDISEGSQLVSELMGNGYALSRLNLQTVRQKFKGIEEKTNYTCTVSGKTFPRVLAVIGGDYLHKDSKVPNTKIHYLDKETGELKALTNIPFQEENSACGMGYKCCVIGKDLYISGGEKNRGRNKWCLDVWRYDAMDDVWDVPTELPRPRRHHGVCSDGQNMYLIGGFGSYRCVLDTVDVYNVNTGEWSNLPQLPTAEFSTACACDHGDTEHIYVVKSSVHVYSKQTETWTTLNPALPYNTILRSLHIFGNKMVFISEYKAQLLVYSLQQTTQELPTALVLPLCGFKEACGGGCFVNGVFYMVGGSDMDESSLIEAFDTRDGGCRTIKDFGTPLANHECVALPFLSKVS